METNNLTVRHLCAATHRGPLPETTPGAQLCLAHIRTGREHIDYLATNWHRLADTTLGSRDGTGRCGRNSTPPLNLHILAIIDPRSTPRDGVPPIAGNIHYWATLIAEDRELESLSLWDTPGKLARLATHWTWATGQQFAADMLTELRRSAHALATLFGEGPPAAIATCQAPHPDPQVDDICGGPLRHDRWLGMQVRCANCGDTWTQDDIAFLARLMADSDTPDTASA